MQSWEYDLLPAMARPPYSPAQLLNARARLVHELLALAMGDLARDTPTPIAITLAHVHGLAEQLWAQTRAEVAEETMELGYEEEEPC